MMLANDSKKEKHVNDYYLKNNFVIKNEFLLLFDLFFLESNQFLEMIFSLRLENELFIFDEIWDL